MGHRPQCSTHSWLVRRRRRPQQLQAIRPGQMQTLAFPSRMPPFVRSAVPPSHRLNVYSPLTSCSLLIPTQLQLHLLGVTSTLACRVRTACSWSSKADTSTMTSRTRNTRPRRISFKDGPCL
ncbi:hypothetical protein FKP32DRAFT_19301 [Trametes sanguinea]|nr:hypothetical protein FKP32DRAFT_19301 [Trametes sanguinea]